MVSTLTLGMLRCLSCWFNYSGLLFLKHADITDVLHKLRASMLALQTIIYDLEGTAVALTVFCFAAVIVLVQLRFDGCKQQIRVPYLIRLIHLQPMCIEACNVKSVMAAAIVTTLSSWAANA